MDKKINNFDFDFMPIGQAIKKAREAKKVTREQLAEIVDYSARHIQSVENEGQHPSFELFIQLITMFDFFIASSFLIVNVQSAVSVQVNPCNIRDTLP